MIDILMATYNGEQFVKEQINSILNQTNTNWKLKIRDDGSKDNTLKILKEYQSKHPDKIEVIEDNKGNVGVINNYSLLLSRSNADYTMFCDQDDIWLPLKIEKTLQKMLETEKLNSGKPVLVHTDMKVVDSDLNVISNSFFKYQKLNPNIKKINNLLVQNNATGCTSMINKALKGKVKLPLSENVLMHDWFIALNAALFGLIEYIPQPTMLYRQHGHNSVGAKGYDLKYILEKIKRIFINDSIYKCQLQADSIVTDNEVVRAFVNLKTCNFFERKISMFKHHFFKSGFLRNVGLLIVI
jgi:glycosyltransferase involved in cell wall biosynthesis